MHIGLMNDRRRGIIIIFHKTIRPVIIIFALLIVFISGCSIFQKQPELDCESGELIYQVESYTGEEINPERFNYFLDDFKEQCKKSITGEYLVHSLPGYKIRLCIAKDAEMKLPWGDGMPSLVQIIDVGDQPVSEGDRVLILGDEDESPQKN